MSTKSVFFSTLLDSYLPNTITESFEFNKIDETHLEFSFSYTGRTLRVKLEEYQICVLKRRTLTYELTPKDLLSNEIALTAVLPKVPNNTEKRDGSSSAKRPMRPSGRVTKSYVKRLLLLCSFVRRKLLIYGLKM